MTEQAQRFATGSRLLWPKGVNSWYMKSFTPVPFFWINSWSLKLGYFSSEILQLMMMMMMMTTTTNYPETTEKWLYTQNPWHPPPLFRTPGGQKANTTNNKKTHLNKKTTNQAQAFQPPPHRKKTKKTKHTIFTGDTASRVGRISGLGSFPHCGVDDFP